MYFFSFSFTVLLCNGWASRRFLGHPLPQDFPFLLHILALDLDLRFPLLLSSFQQLRPPKQPTSVILLLYISSCIPLFFPIISSFFSHILS